MIDDDSGAPAARKPHTHTMPTIEITYFVKLTADQVWIYIAYFYSRIFTNHQKMWSSAFRLDKIYIY